MRAKHLIYPIAGLALCCAPRTATAPAMAPDFNPVYEFVVRGADYNAMEDMPRRQMNSYFRDQTTYATASPRSKDGRMIIMTRKNNKVWIKISEKSMQHWMRELDGYSFYSGLMPNTVKMIKKIKTDYIWQRSKIMEARRAQNITYAQTMPFNR